MNFVIDLGVPRSLGTCEGDSSQIWRNLSSDIARNLQIISFDS